MFALIGYMVFALVNLGFSMFAGMSVYSSPFGWLIALVGSFVFGFVVLYADGVGAEGVPVLDIAICQCDPPMYLHPVRCHTISGYPRPCSV